MEMPPDYICHKCSFNSKDCEVCVNTDILPIPFGELDGGNIPEKSIRSVLAAAWKL